MPVAASRSTAAARSWPARTGGERPFPSGTDSVASCAARKLMLPTKESGAVDLGQVGEVQSIDPSVIQALEAGGFIPVVAPIGTGADGTT